MILVATSRARNTGMKYSSGGDMIEKLGQKPVLTQPVKATITLSVTQPEKISIFSLDFSGTRQKEVPVAINGNQITFTINSDYQSLTYEITRN